MSPELTAKLRQARRRLNVTRFLKFAVWSTVACVSIAAGVVLIDKWSHWGVDAFLAGAIAVGTK